MNMRSTFQSTDTADRGDFPTGETNTVRLGFTREDLRGRGLNLSNAAFRKLEREGQLARVPHSKSAVYSAGSVAALVSAKPTFTTPAERRA